MHKQLICNLLKTVNIICEKGELRISGHHLKKHHKIIVIGFFEVIDIDILDKKQQDEQSDKYKWQCSQDHS
jgi:hypothetical protein